MKTFREIVQEALGYKVDVKTFKTFKKLDQYDTEVKGDITLYRLKGEDVFRYNEKTGELVVIKRGWQKMNIERGF